jgi:ammonium transporter, Amt family
MLIEKAGYILDDGAIGWVLISTCLVFFMIPGVGYYYGGITQKKNQLTLLISAGLAVSMVSIQVIIISIFYL